MIETSLSRVKIHEVIESQIPEAIDSDNPLLGTFLKQYYISQEFQGGPVDIAENLTDYKSVDFLNKDNLTGFTSTSQYTQKFSKTIYVDSTKGWPSKYGLLKIDDEIITYTGIGSSFPSGHAAAAHLYAHLLSKYTNMPTDRLRLNDFADRVAKSRLVLGVHTLEDLTAGKELARSYIQMNRL